MSSLNPNVTIRFSGEGDQAINASNAVGTALDNLAIKSRNARAGLQSVSLMMDQVAGRAQRVATLGQAYQSAATGIQATLTASRASAAGFANMGAAADAARARVERLNAAGGAPPRQVRRSPLPTGGSGPDPSVNLGDIGASTAGLLRMGAAVLGVTVGLAAAGQQVKALVSANMDLDVAMSAVAAVGNLDKMSEQYRDLTKLVIDFGGKTQYSAAQAAEGLKELIAGGYSAADSAILLKDTLSLAATENMALGRASEIVVAGLQSFHMGVDQSARLTNVLARGANASTASIDGMGEAFKYLAPVASAMGISVEESAAAVALLANNGLQAGLAGRGMSGVMSRMIAPSKDAQAVLAKFGVTLADINPEIAGLGGAMKALEKIDTAGLVTLFGAENLDVSNVLKSNSSQFANLVSQMKDVSITAEGMAAKKNDNAGGDFKKMSAAIQEVRVELGKDLYASMREYVKSFTDYLHENRDAIVDTVKHVGSLAVSLIPLVEAYVAVKAVGMVGVLAGTITKWGVERTIIELNSTALMRNAEARALVARAGKAAATGAVVGGVIGANMAPEDAGKLETAGYIAGGAVVGAVTGTVATGLANAAAPTVAGWAASLATAAGGAGAAVGTAMVAAITAPFTILAAAGTAVAVVANAPLAYQVVKWANSADDATEAINNAGGAALNQAARMLNSAKTQEELDKGKIAVARTLAAVKADIANAASNGTSDEELQTLQFTKQGLEQHLRLSQGRLDKVVAVAAAEREQGLALQRSEQHARDIAEALQIAKVEAENLANAGEKMAEGLPDFGKLIIESLPDAEALNIFKGQEENAVSAANAARAGIEASLKKARVDTSLIDKDRAITDTDDVIAYARAAFSLLKKNDKNGNLLGTDEAAALKKSVEDALAAKKAARGKSNDIDGQESARVKTAQEISSIESEIAINQAKAAGNTAEVKKLEREKALLEEKVKLQALLTKDIVKGSKTEVEDRAAAIKKADALAERSVDAKFAAERKVSGPVVTLGSAAQGINSFFGRSANAGMMEEAKKHTALLAAIKESLGGKPPTVKTEISIKPVFNI